MKKTVLIITASLLAYQASSLSAQDQVSAPTIAKSINLLLMNVISEHAGFALSKEDAEIKSILQKAKTLAEKNDLKGSFAAIESINGILKKAGITEKIYNFKVEGKEYNNDLFDMLNRAKQGLVPYSTEINKSF